jgi:hypothetical protein
VAAIAKRKSNLRSSSSILLSSPSTPMASFAGLVRYLPRVLVVVVLSLLLSDSALGQPAILNYDDCFSSTGNTSEKLNVMMVYAQILRDNKALNLTVIGQSNIPIVGRSNDSTKLGEFPSILPRVHIWYLLSTPSHIIYVHADIDL